MKTWKACCASLTAAAVLLPANAALAQIPAAPPVAAPPLPGAPIEPAVPAATPATIWQKLGVSKSQRLACKYQFCQSKIGQLLNNATMPLSMLTGGMLGNCCPQMPTPYDLAKGGAEGAAAAIKADTLQAKARRAALRYLATVDCHWWPDAEKAFILALRTDHNECVRWEAAMAMGSGCCCTRPVIEALAISASGSDKDKNVSENCERVRAAAEASLMHCLACYENIQTVPPEAIKERAPERERVPERTGPGAAAPGNLPAILPGMTAVDPEQAKVLAYYDQVKNRPLAVVVSDARRAMEKRKAENATASALPTGSHDLMHIVATAKAEHPSVASRKDGLATMPGSAAIEVAATPGMTPVRATPQAGATSTAMVAPSFAPSVAPSMVPSTATEPAAPPKDKYTVPASFHTHVSDKVDSAMPAMPSGRATVPVLMPTTSTMVQTPASSYAPASMSKPGLSSSTSNSTPKASGASDTEIQPLLTVLRTSNFPSQRQWAVETMAGNDMGNRPAVVAALLTSATQDASAMVRAACVRSLAKMRLHSPQVVSVYQLLQNDIDPQVRREATVAMTHSGTSLEMNVQTR